MTETMKDLGPVEATGFRARVIQHEIDHMVGSDLVFKAEKI